MTMGAYSTSATNGVVMAFEKDPDFENPKDVNQDNAYKFNVVSTDEDGLTGMQAVTVEVTNLDEDGSVSMSTTQPTLGRAVTASVSDPDGGINDRKLAVGERRHRDRPSMDEYRWRHVGDVHASVRGRGRPGYNND